MKIIVTQHAQLRLEDRGITINELINAILAPTKIKEDIGVSLLIKTRKNGQLLLVYYTLDGSYIKVITVISTSKISKYLD